MLELDGQWLPFPKQNVVGLNAGVSKQLYIPTAQKYNSENPMAGILKTPGPEGYFHFFKDIKSFLFIKTIFFCSGFPLFFITDFMYVRILSHS